MFDDYEKVKYLMKKSFSEILLLMDEKNLSYEEIKDLMVKLLYKLSKEEKKDVTKKPLITPDVKVETITMPQVLYGPPNMDVYEDVVVETITMPQVLYGPPNMGELETMVVESKKELDGNYILGTNIPKPREKRLEETDNEYLDYLEKYYGRFFPNKNSGKTRR